MDHLLFGYFFVLTFYVTCAVYFFGTREQRRSTVLKLLIVFSFVYSLHFIFSLSDGSVSEATLSIYMKAAIKRDKNEMKGIFNEDSIIDGGNQKVVEGGVSRLKSEKKSSERERSKLQHVKSKPSTEYLIISKNDSLLLKPKDNEGEKSLIMKSTNPSTEEPTHMKYTPTSRSIDVSVLQVEAVSSREGVTLSVNGSVIYNVSCSKEPCRGIHVCVLNQHTGVLMAQPMFDTYSFDFGDLEETINSIRNGRVMVFIVGDEGAMSLKKRTRVALANLGGRYALNLGYRHTWVFACIKGVKALAESHNAKEKPSIINFNVTLQENIEKCNWKDDTGGRAQQRFCSMYVGYASLCNCSRPLDIAFETPTLRGKTIDLPIAVMAANRPHYLYQMLQGLVTTPGVNRSMVTVFIDGRFQGPAELATMFKVNYLYWDRLCARACGISQNYRRSLSYIFKRFPNINYTIILEEDLDVSADIMDYFLQMLPLLETDESLYCVSAWNDQGYIHSSNDSSLLYRIETMPGLGWVLKRKLFIDELEPKWPGTDKMWDWDMWMRVDSNRKGRECIIPDISRTFHFGKTGVNMNPYFHEVLFKYHALNKKTDIRFDISVMDKLSYEREMHKIIKSAEVLDHSKSPCDTDFIPDTTNHTYVAFIDVRNWDTWSKFATCFKIWHLDVRGFHKGMFRLWMKQNKLFVVGDSSPYAMYKPGNLTVLYLPKEKKKKS